MELKRQLNPIYAGAIIIALALLVGGCAWLKTKNSTHVPETTSQEVVANEMVNFNEVEDFAKLYDGPATLSFVDWSLEHDGFVIQEMTVDGELVGEPRPISKQELAKREVSQTSISRHRTQIKDYLRGLDLPMPGLRLVSPHKREYLLGYGFRSPRKDGIPSSLTLFNELTRNQHQLKIDGDVNLASQAALLFWSGIDPDIVYLQYGGPSEFYDETTILEYNIRTEEYEVMEQWGRQLYGTQKMSPDGSKILYVGFILEEGQKNRPQISEEGFDGKFEGFGLWLLDLKTKQHKLIREINAGAANEAYTGGWYDLTSLDPPKGSQLNIRKNQANSLVFSLPFVGTYGVSRMTNWTTSGVPSMKPDHLVPTTTTYPTNSCGHGFNSNCNDDGTGGARRTTDFTNKNVPGSSTSGQCNREPIYAAYEGEVIYVGYNTSFGNLVIIGHDDDGVDGVEPEESSTFYAHLSVIYAQKGDMVTTSDIIGLEGNTGKSGGEHLHFEVRKSATFSATSRYWPLFAELAWDNPITTNIVETLPGNTAPKGIYTSSHPANPTVPQTSLVVGPNAAVQTLTVGDVIQLTDQTNYGDLVSPYTSSLTNNTFGSINLRKSHALAFQYGNDPSNQEGPEAVYEVVVNDDGILKVEISNEDLTSYTDAMGNVIPISSSSKKDDMDFDVFILSNLSPGSNIGTRTTQFAEASVVPGTYYVSVDAYMPNCLLSARPNVGKFDIKFSLSPCTDPSEPNSNVAESDAVFADYMSNISGNTTYPQAMRDIHNSQSAGVSGLVTLAGCFADDNDAEYFVFPSAANANTEYTFTVTSGNALVSIYNESVTQTYPIGTIGVNSFSHCIAPACSDRYLIVRPISGRSTDNWTVDIDFQLGSGCSSTNFQAGTNGNLAVQKNAVSPCDDPPTCEDAHEPDGVNDNSFPWGNSPFSVGQSGSETAMFTQHDPANTGWSYLNLPAVAGTVTLTWHMPPGKNYDGTLMDNNWITLTHFNNPGDQSEVFVWQKPANKTMLRLFQNSLGDWGCEQYPITIDWVPDVTTSAPCPNTDESGWGNSITLTGFSTTASSTQTQNALLNTATDADVYYTLVPSPGTMEVTISGAPADLNIQFEYWNGTAMTPTTWQLVSANTSYSLPLNPSVTTPWPLNVYVSSAGGYDCSDTYELEFDWTPASVDCPNTDESGWGNSITLTGFSTTASSTQTENALLNDANDVDVYDTFLPSPGTMELTVSSAPVDLHVQFEYWNGSAMVSTGWTLVPANSSYSHSLSPVLTTSWPYNVYISSAGGYDCSNTYELEFDWTPTGSSCTGSDESDPYNILLFNNGVPFPIGQSTSEQKHLYANMNGDMDYLKAEAIGAGDVEVTISNVPVDLVVSVWHWDGSYPQSTGWVTIPAGTVYNETFSSTEPNDWIVEMIIEVTGGYDCDNPYTVEMEWDSDVSLPCPGDDESSWQDPITLTGFDKQSGTTKNRYYHINEGNDGDVIQFSLPSPGEVDVTISSLPVTVLVEVSHLGQPETRQVLAGGSTTFHLDPSLYGGWEVSVAVYGLGAFDCDDSYRLKIEWEPDDLPDLQPTLTNRILNEHSYNHWWIETQIENTGNGNLNTPIPVRFTAVPSGAYHSSSIEVDSWLTSLSSGYGIQVGANLNLGLLPPGATESYQIFASVDPNNWVVEENDHYTDNVILLGTYYQHRPLYFAPGTSGSQLSLTKSVDSVLTAEVINVYPNPANQQVTLSWNDSEEKKVSFGFYDLFGKQHFTKHEKTKVGSNEFTFDVTTIPEGIHVVYITKGKKKIAKKFSILR